MVAGTRAATNGRPPEVARPFDAYEGPAALLDASGCIVEANDAWQAFAARDRGLMEHAAVGTDFPALMARWPGGGRAGPGWVGLGICEVLSGVRSVFVFEYPSPEEDRMLLFRAVASATARGPGAVVFHTNVPDPARVVTARKALAVDRPQVADAPTAVRRNRPTELERLVSAAVRTGVVTLAYQPVARLEDEQVVGAEALLRMGGPAMTAYAPLEVIAAAERIGLGDELGILVVRTACREAADWQRQLPERRLTVSVNLSAGQVQDLDLPDKVRTVLEETQLDPSLLAFEIAESVLLDDVPTAARQLARLRMLGVQLTADDFGAGYSSLLTLRRLPLDAVKADISFVAGLPGSPEDVAILGAVMGVANALGLRVVAKGVENRGQLAELRRLGCDDGQGYHWSPGVAGAAFLAVVNASSTGAAADGSAAADGDPAGRSGAGRVVEDDLDVVFRALAHEIRTPLTVVMGYSSLLETTLGDGDDGVAATSIRQAAERISHLVSNLEDVRMIDHGTLRLDVEVLDLRTLARDHVAEMATVLGRSVVLEHDRRESLMAEVDRPRVQQVLTNLISNAAKFSPRGSVITVAVIVDGDWVDVSVADEGPGIGPAEVGLMFRKYARGDRTRPGSGLGLYLARGTARAHGGDITFRRGRYGTGSVFTLRLPYQLPR